MNPLTLSDGAGAIIDWLGQLGPRWGLPGDACRIHGLLFLVARPAAATEIAAALILEDEAVAEGLTWLSRDHLAVEGPHGWSTQADPWMLVTQALEARREREMEAALAVREEWDRSWQNDDPVVGRQARRLFDLVEDIAAIDAGTRRLSPEMMRTMIGLGGRAARLAERAFGSRKTSP